ncbi:hypothetical protein C8A05DRAFT_29789 [Staphylotrichum tortipilum]|uniref:High-osmolarity-induced transcription protein 1 n=1 Tax=Staphylotrichum tortipilum TaxID=2831512 RepID=A0AAN6RWR9_9PEZI|nr:hypothetical protein C8A05DRAFT_29789 [Staphylotrichum longicolle]
MADSSAYAAAEERAGDARRAGLQAKKEEQPLNTTRSYAAKQREWRTWCSTPRAAPDGTLSTWPDGELVTPDKLSAWLSEDILLRRVKVPKRKKGRAAGGRPLPAEEQAALREAEDLATTMGVPMAEAVQMLSNDREGYVPPPGIADAAASGQEEGDLFTKGTVDAYIAAVIELWRVQVAHGNKNTENPRGAAVRGFLEQRARQRNHQNPATFKDRGTEGIQAGYSSTEWLAIHEHLLHGAAALPQNLRTRVDLLFGHYYLLRGENRRKLELADLSLLDYPREEGPTLCGCLVLLLKDGKMNKTGKKEFMGSLRHKDPLLCTQGALAQLLFWRWHIVGEPSPSFRRRQDWYKIKVLVDQDRQEELSYSTQLQDTWRVFGTVGLTTAKKIHLPQRAGAQEAETYGTSLAQISQAGRWNQSVLCQAYLKHLPRQFMRIVAGFSGTQGDFFLPRAVYEPPVALQRQLWPWVEEWEPRFEARSRRRRWAQGGLDEDDLAGDGFLKLMRRLRIVLLQDLAVLQPRFPTLPFFGHAPFCGHEWEGFARTVQASVEDTTEPPSLLLQRALPEIYGVMDSTRKALLHSNHQLLDALLSGRAPITITGYLGGGPLPLPGPSPGPLPGPEPGLVPVGEVPPVVTSLAKVFTVQDAWREWKEGLGGRQPVQDLEERWGSLWRPGNNLRVQFCRRKVIWDAILARIARGKSEEDAVAEVERLREGQSLNRLVDILRRRRQRHGQPGEGLRQAGPRI